MSFFGPRGIVFHPQKRLVFITDTGNHQVKVISPKGEPMAQWGKPGGGSEVDDFKEPVGIDILPDGNLVIVDSRNRRLKIYTPEGERIRHWPIQTSWDGESGFEGHVACSPDGNIYLTDPKEGNVHVYDSVGKLLEKVDMDVNGQPLQKPVGITYTHDGRILVSDWQANRVAQIAKF